MSMTIGFFGVYTTTNEARAYPGHPCLYGPSPTTRIGLYCDSNSRHSLGCWLRVATVQYGCGLLATLLCAVGGMHEGPGYRGSMAKKLAAPRLHLMQVGQRSTLPHAPDHKWPCRATGSVRPRAASTRPRFRDVDRQALETIVPGCGLCGGSASRRLRRGSPGWSRDLLNGFGVIRTSVPSS